jgi:antitoxin HicB
MKNKNLNYYLNLPWSYTIETEKYENNTSFYIISVNELTGVKTDAYSVEEGMALIKEVLEGTIKLYMKQGEEIPEPIDPELYKGHISYRTTGRRHYLIAKEASKRHTSLSKIINELIDQGLVRN